MALKNNRVPLVCPQSFVHHFIVIWKLKLELSFRNDEIRATEPNHHFYHYDLDEFGMWPWRMIGHLFHAPRSYVCHSKNHHDSNSNTWSAQRLEHKGKVTTLQTIFWTCCDGTNSHHHSNFHQLVHIGNKSALISICSGNGSSPVNSSPLNENGCKFADNIFKCIFMNKKFCISIQISMKFVAKGLIDNKSTLVQVMA